MPAHRASPGFPLPSGSPSSVVIQLRKFKMQSQTRFLVQINLQKKYFFETLASTGFH
jgi:hypothetical protein